jgi:hypothetical protein
VQHCLLHDAEEGGEAAGSPLVTCATLVTWAWAVVVRSPIPESTGRLAPVLTFTCNFLLSCSAQYGNKCLKDASALGGAGPDKLAEIDAG